MTLGISGLWFKSRTPKQKPTAKAGSKSKKRKKNRPKGKVGYEK